MSGSNPFRPKKPEGPATVTAQPTSTPATPATPPATAPAPVTTTTTTTTTPTATHPTSDTDDNDRSSDDTDLDSTDPFGQVSYLSDDGYNGENNRGQASHGTKGYSKRPLPAPPARPASISSGSSILARQPSNASIDSRSLSSRPSTRERKPPPPPKNHHGKLINPTSISPETTARTGTTPGTPYSTKHLGPDYFTPGPSQDENQPVGLGPGSGSGSGSGPGPETLRRSHSQYKRPPTPPLSRRHSQMTRSKSTLSKINPNRLLMPGTTDESESPPSSPEPDDSVSSKYSREDQSVVQASPIESSSPGKIPARRGSAQAQAQGPATTTPPPPPPRPRRAARPGSIISDRPSQENHQQQQQQQNHRQEGFPHPSNANHILEDLSRLQKEVDDLRGRYENRKSVT